MRGFLKVLNLWDDIVWLLKQVASKGRGMLAAAY